MQLKWQLVKEFVLLKPSLPLISAFAHFASWNHHHHQPTACWEDLKEG
jgi:hypothetical protein